MNKQNKKYSLLLVGKGLPSKEYWLKELNAFGYELNCIDFEKAGKFKKYFSDFIKIGKKTQSENALLSTIEEINLRNWLIDGVLCIEEMYVPFSIHLAEYYKKKAICLSQYSYFLRNKYLMRKQFEAFNILNPKYCLANNRESLNYAIQEVGVPVVIKPVEMTGSLGVFKVSKKSDAFNYFEIARHCDFKAECNRLYFNLSNDCLIEEWITGQEWSVEIAVQNGKCYLLAITTKYTTREPYFDEMMHIVYNSKTFIKDHKNVYKLAIKGVRALKIKNAICHAEIKGSKKGSLKIMEIAARPGGGMIPKLVNLARGLVFSDIAAKICLGIPIQLKYDSDEKAALVGFINSNQSGKITKYKIENYKNDKSSNTNVITIVKYYKEGQFVYIDNGNQFARIGHIIVVSNTPKNALKIFKKIISDLELEIV